MHKQLSALLVAILYFAVVGIIYTLKVDASIQSCSAALTPRIIKTGTDAVIFHFQITNNDSVAGRWVKFAGPSSAMTITSVSVSGWSTSHTADEVILENGILNPGAVLAVDVEADLNTGSVGGGWITSLSDTTDESGATECSGDLDIEETPNPIFSDIAASNITTSSVSISWQTDVPATSLVNYGPNQDYSQSTTLDTNLVTSHSVTINGLTKASTYHYQVVSKDGSDNEAQSPDNTFLTAASDPVTTNNPVTTKIPIKSVPTENIPPVITLVTDISKPQKRTPTISGTASDNEALAGIDYSVDGGKNWLPVDKASGLGGKKSDFSFTPQNLKDGNYEVVARAIDTSGNVGKSQSYQLVIDLLPPIVGGSVTYVGSQPLLPDDSGTIQGLTGVDQKITLSAVGGPIKITLGITEVGQDKKLQTFSLVYSPDTGLWTGVLTFSKAGDFQLIATSVDGAGNVTSRAINNVHVSDSGRVTDGKQKAVEAHIKVFFKEPETNRWVLWDGQAYGQDNPIATNKDGIYGFYLPAGTYYLEAAAAGYQKTITRSFSVNTAKAISVPIVLAKKPGFDLGPLHVRLPWFSLSQAPLNLSPTKTTKNQSTKFPDLPQFSLLTTDGKTISTKDLYGKPTILSFINTWAATGREQLALLSSASAPSLILVTVTSGESLAKITAYSKVAGYSIPLVSDENNQLIQNFSISTIPVHYFLDPHGVVKKVMVGLLSNQELLNNVSF